ncbi:hypothetical protein [Chryseobacterium balustinum]|uniref:Uncharacterized protein n=2 Tax=Chryseobacterium balustinum TaxID=246 RepID=A0AAX2IQZ6_9FLAO|nr:hypothetical protein [Chryseobacterium balustinum]SKC12243.1 hypothetical protein SAMN05421800_1393 [Chryseobacterium balustinum]SQA92560.1 Uncharacterised protein [Chryseobacterium balustinum]
MENFISKNQEAWRKNFRVNSKMKSLNKKLLALYDIILKNERTDSDYWYFIGADEFINYFSYLDTDDFQELISDIPNWTEDQKWILRECLSYGGLRYDNHRKSKTFENQSLLLTFLFSVTNDEDVKAYIFENADIINDGQPKPYHLLIMIKTWADKHIPHTPNEIHYQNLDAAIKKASC